MKKKNIQEQYSNMTFAKAAEAIGKKWKNKDTDLIEKASYEKELEDLASFQEKKKLVSQMQEAVKQFKKGGMLPKYSTGGLMGDPLNPKKTFSTLADQPPFIPEVGAMPPLDLNTLGSGLFGQTMPTHPNQVTPLKVNDPSNVQVGDNTVLTRDNPVTLNNTQPRTTGQQSEMSAYTPALLGQGISTALNLGILAQGYDKQSPVENPYESQVKNLLASRNIDTTQQRNQILSAYQAAKNNINNARSANVRNALDTNLMNTTQDSLASSKLQEQQLNNAYVGEYANALGGLGQAKVAARTYAEDVNAKNKGQFLSNVSAFGASAADNSKFFTTSKLNTIQNKLLGDILNSKYADVGLNKEVVNRLSEGKLTPDDITILKKAYGEEAATQLIKKFGE